MDNRFKKSRIRFLALVLVGTALAGFVPHLLAFGELSDEAVALWQRRESVQSHIPGFDIWYSVAGRDSEGALGWHARHPDGTIVQDAGAPLAPPFGAPPAGDDKNPHVSVAGSRAVAIWQHSDGVSAEAVQWSIWSSELDLETGEWTDFSILAQGTPREEHFDPAVAVDTDSALAVWVRRTNVAGLPREIVFAVRTNGTWSLPSPVGFTGGRASLPEVTFTSVPASTGSLFTRYAVAVWSDVGSAGMESPHKMFFSVFDGLDWSPPAEIATEVSTPAIPDVAFANYDPSEEMPFGSHGRFGLTADALGKIYVLWSGGPEIFGECTILALASCPQPAPSPGVAGAILDIAANSWEPMRNPNGGRNLALKPNSKNPDAVVTTPEGQFVGAFDAPVEGSAADLARIEDTVSTGSTFSFGEPAYNSPLTDLRPTVTALSATEVIALNWNVEGHFLWNFPTTIVWSFGQVMPGNPPDTVSDVAWSERQFLTPTGSQEQNMFPEVASSFAATLATPDAPDVDTTSPIVTITSPANGATVSGTISVTADASDNVGVAGVQFKVDGVNIGAEDTTAPYSVSWDTTTAADGSHTLTAVARDAAGNTTTSSPVTITVSNGPAPDTTPPTVVITSPESGATVSGTISITADASDNVGVAGVQFKVDGVNIGAEDTTAPYSVNWDTTTAADGSHTLTAVAGDEAGNTTTSSPVTVTVDNAASPPPSSGLPSGSYLDFDGIDDFVNIGNLLSPGSSQLTVEAWVNKRDTTSDGRVIARSDSPFPSDSGYIFSLGVAGRTIRVRLTGTSLDGGSIVTDAWTHLAFTYDGLILKIFVNGALTASMAKTGSIPASSVTALIGNNDLGSSRFWNGSIEEVRVWSIARTQTQIQNGMDTELAGTEAGLLAYYKLNEGSGQSAQDSSGNGHTGTLGSTSAAESSDPAWTSVQP